MAHGALLDADISKLTRQLQAPAAAPRQHRSARRTAATHQRQDTRQGRLTSVRVSATATLERPPAASTSKAKPSTQKPTVVITGASSGLGLAAAKALSDEGKWHVVMACRDWLKAEQAAKRLGMPKENYTVMHLDLAALDSVRQFLSALRSSGRRVDAVVCNAAVYLPTAKEPRYTADGFELSVGVNHLGHFLLANELMEDLKKAPEGSLKRMIIVGSITGNTNTVAGNVPPKADLGDLRGLSAGLDGRAAAMINGGDFDGAKAYKDSKVCNMLTMRELHRRYHDSTGITFASLYPGCIAETGLFREHYKLFRTLFPPFQKYITKGYVSEEEAGRRLAQVITDPKLGKSGVYWSWNKDANSFENDVSEEVGNAAKGQKLFDISAKLLNLDVA